VLEFFVIVIRLFPGSFYCSPAKLLIPVLKVSKRVNHKLNCC